MRNIDQVSRMLPLTRGRSATSMLDPCGEVMEIMIDDEQRWASLSKEEQSYLSVNQ